MSLLKVKKRLKEISFGTFLHENFFMYILLICNHTVYLVQFICICEYFKYHLFEKLIRVNEFQIELKTV